MSAGALYAKPAGGLVSPAAELLLHFPVNNHYGVSNMFHVLLSNFSKNTFVAAEFTDKRLGRSATFAIYLLITPMASQHTVFVVLASNLLTIRYVI